MQVTSRQDWLAHRAEVLAAEKELTRARDALAARRRAMPMVEITAPYLFDTADGPATLADLFGGHRQLIVYHFMFGPDWDQGCPSCSFWADQFDGVATHLAARDTRSICVSRAPLDRLAAYRQRMGWRFDWVSSLSSRFNEDFGVTLPPGDSRYNYAPRSGDAAEMPGLSTFLRDGDRVLHSYSTYARGLDMFNAAYQLLDLTPLGRQEDDLPWTMAWLRRHDSY